MNKKNVVLNVLGDTSEDILVIANNPDYRKRILEPNTQIIKSFGAVQVIPNFFKENNIKEVTCNYAKNCTYTSISKWDKLKVNKQDRLFLNENISISVREDGKSNYQSEIRTLGDNELYVIHNVSDEIEYKFDKCSDSTWFIIRTLFQIDQNPTKLISNFPDCYKHKTVLLININDLRKGGFNIKEGISWEQLTYQTYKAIKKYEKLNDFRYIVISYEQEGALVISNNHGEKFVLSYINSEIEGEYIKKIKRNSFSKMITMEICMIMFMLQVGLNNVNLSTITYAAASSILAIRKIIDKGYSLEGKYPYKDIYDLILDIQQSYNSDEFEKILSENKDLKNISINNEVTIFPFKKEILDCGDNFSILNFRNEIELCKNIARNGITKSLSGIPYLRYEKFISVDRFEMENYRKIYNLISKYLTNKNINKPISVCVFGPPGSGKSFGVKQLANYINKNTKNVVTETIEFNLSQMHSFKELSHSLHQIRDLGLKGKIPIVFWDEFDVDFNNNKFGWLKYFLAPMQDGEFIEDSIIHFIGKAIFVFAGGICSSMYQFSNTEDKGYKLKDFISRLKGYIDVSGPNKKMCPYNILKLLNDFDNEPMSDNELNKKIEKSIDEIPCTENVDKSSQNEERCVRLYKEILSPRNGNNDIIKKMKMCEDSKIYCMENCYQVRRAILLRTLLEKKFNLRHNHNIAIDDKVLDLFLNVNSFTHGARSLETIISLSSGSIENGFTLSSLPEDTQLRMYLSHDFKKFLLK